MLRMSDSRALELSDSLLTNFPEILGSLEYLKWNMGEAESSEKERLYRLERSGDRVIAVHWHHEIELDIGL